MNPETGSDISNLEESSYFGLTQRGLDEFGAILQKTFLQSFSCMKIVIFWFSFQWKFSSLQKTSIGLENGLAQKIRQAI